MTLVLRWRAPERPIQTRWQGPDGMAEAVTRNPELPIAAIIGPPGPAGAAGAQGAAGPQGVPGPPGAGAELGLATAISARSVPAMVNAINSSGYSAHGKGAGTYVSDALATSGLAAAHPRFCKQSADGRYWRLAPADGWVTDTQAGALVDGATFDDAAISALAAYVAAIPGIRKIRFIPGIRMVLPTGAGSAATVFGLTSIDGLTIDWSGAVFDCARTFAEAQATGNSTVFRFDGCQNLKATGQVQFTGPLTKAQISGAASAYGNIGIVLDGNCSGFHIDASAEGMLEPLLLTRSPRIKLDASKAPFIGAGGTGYTVGDVLTLANMGGAATTNATLTVATVSSGVITAVSVTTPGLFPNFYDSGVAAATRGFAVTGGSGSGALICPYTLDHDAEVLGNKTTGGAANIIAHTCFYGYNAQWNGDDCDINVDADLVFRAYFVFGASGQTGRLRIRNQSHASTAASVAGLGYSGALHITVLPATEAGWDTGYCIIDAAGESAVPGRVDLAVEWDANRIGSVACGQYLKLSKYTQGGSDTTYPRGHEFNLRIGGRIDGRGTLDSGMSANILGTDVNYTDASWIGEKVNVLLEDGLRVTNCNTYGMAFHANALASLTIGRIDLDCSIRLDALLSGIALAPRGLVKVDPSARFANRFASVGGHYGLGDINVAASFAVSPQLTETRFHHTGGAITITATLPDAAPGLRYTFCNTGTAGQMNITPQGADRIGTGAGYLGYGAALALTTPGERVTLAVNAGNSGEEWQVETVAAMPYARANHTGTQTAATISDFTEASQDVIGAMVAAAGGTYDDGAGTITLPGGGLADGDKGDITVSGGGAAWAIDAGAVSLAKMADVASGTVFYRKTAASGVPEVQTLATLKTDLGLTGTNSGDQTSIVGISGTLAQFNSAVTDADLLSVAAAAAAYQPFDGQLTDLAGLAYASNALKVIRVNAAETGLELATISGGGGSPGGNSGELQYNNAGAFAGAANVEVEGGNLKLVSTTDPAAPAGGLLLYSKLIAGRHLPKIIGPSGIDTVLQVGMHGNSVFMVAPASGTTAPTAWGGTLTTAATMSMQLTVASANPWQATQRKRFATTATAGNGSGMRTAYAQWFRGNAAGYGGFFFRTQIGQNLNVNGAQVFHGLCASTAVLASTAGAVSALLNSIGMGYDTTDASTGNWQLFRNDGSGTATKVDLGATNAARNTTHGYDLIIYCPPGAATEIFVRVVNLHTNVVVLDTSYTTDLPAVNTGLAYKGEGNNGAVASAMNLEVAKVYIESDY